MKPELFISIVTYNNPIGCKELISDFYRLHDPDSFRICVVDQTKDGIIFDKECPVHLHLKVYRNIGFSKAHNLAWRMAGTPYTLLANDDVRLLNKDWFGSAKACLTQKGVLAVNSFPATRTWNAGGEPVWYWDLPANEGKFDFIKDKKFEEYTDEDYEKLKVMLNGGDPPGTAMFFTLLKTEARDIVGYLDEAYWNNGEDYDWNRRCFIKGYKILTCTHSLVHHQCGVTKQNAAKAKETTGYDLVANAKNIFNKKWGTKEEPNPDIYGRSGTKEPNTPWYTEIPL